MCGGGGSPPVPKAPDPPKKEDTAKKVTDLAKAEAKRKGQASTMLAGDVGMEDVKKRKLLGQKDPTGYA